MDSPDQYTAGVGLLFVENLVSGIQAGGPAAADGQVVEGDRLCKINQTLVGDPTGLVQEVSQGYLRKMLRGPEGTTLELTFFRQNSQQTGRYFLVRLPRKEGFGGVPAGSISLISPAPTQQRISVSRATISQTMPAISPDVSRSRPTTEKYLPSYTDVQSTDPPPTPQRTPQSVQYQTPQQERPQQGEQSESSLPMQEEILELLDMMRNGKINEAKAVQARITQSHFLQSGRSEAIPVRYLYNTVSKVCQESQALKAKSHTDDDKIAALRLEIEKMNSVNHLSASSDGNRQTFINARVEAAEKQLTNALAREETANTTIKGLNAELETMRTTIEVISKSQKRDFDLRVAEAGAVMQRTQERVDALEMENRRLSHRVSELETSNASLLQTTERVEGEKSTLLMATNDLERMMFDRESIIADLEARVHGLTDEGRLRSERIVDATERIHKQRLADQKQIEELVHEIKERDVLIDRLRTELGAGGGQAQPKGSPPPVQPSAAQALPDSPPPRITLHSGGRPEYRPAVPLEPGTAAANQANLEYSSIQVLNKALKLEQTIHEAKKHLAS